MSSVTGDKLMQRVLGVRCEGTKQLEDEKKRNGRNRGILLYLKFWKRISKKEEMELQKAFWEGGVLVPGSFFFLDPL